MPARPNPRHVSIEDIGDLVVELLDVIPPRPDRFVLGVTGPPGAGKSSLADSIVATAPSGLEACVAPMDGFHRTNVELADLGLLALKGVPDTFDAAGFVDHLGRLHAGVDITWPTFDRSREAVIADGRLISAAARLVVVEGNYLLLDSNPWDLVRRHLDAVWYLDVPEDVLIPRLRARHERHRTPEDAMAKVRSTDLPNAALVAQTQRRADVIVHAYRRDVAT